MDVLDELKSLFLEDVTELLADAEQAFLSLEQNTENPDMIITPQENKN
jgi:chemotaxis protein histidine kinase CheA